QTRGATTVRRDPQMQLRSRTPGAPPFPLSDRANAPARSQDELAVYSEPGSLKPQPDAVAAVINADGRVLALVDGAAFPVLARTLPAGVGVLVGHGPGATYLRQNAHVYDLLEFQAQPGQ